MAVAPPASNNVRRFREQLRLSQYALAKKTGLAESTILRIENGLIKRPHSLSQQAIAKALLSKVEDVFPDRKE